MRFETIGLRSEVKNGNLYRELRYLRDHRTPGTEYGSIWEVWVSVLPSSICVFLPSSIWEVGVEFRIVFFHLLSTTFDLSFFHLLSGNFYYLTPMWGGSIVLSFSSYCCIFAEKWSPLYVSVVVWSFLSHCFKPISVSPVLIPLLFLHGEA